MKKIEEALQKRSDVHDYKINRIHTLGYQLFFVKGRLETIRSTDNTDTRVTVYVRHDGKIGDADFPVFPSMTDDQLSKSIEEAVLKARLISNEPYDLPVAEIEEHCAEPVSHSPEDLAALTANTIFDANRIPGGSQNSVEVFIESKKIQIQNSRGLKKTQYRRGGMAEVIPTYTGEKQSVELYEQYHFSDLVIQDLSDEITGMMIAAKARYDSVVPKQIFQCPVIFHRNELKTLFRKIAGNLDYTTIYTHAGVFHKGDAVQKNRTGDALNITMCGALENDPNSSYFDSDGSSLISRQIIHDGIAVEYFGRSRFAQYLGETPTGQLPCIQVGPGSVRDAEYSDGQFLEVISMSGLQVDFFSDYIGGEIRLAYLHNSGTVSPVTGISVSGSLKQILSSIRLSEKTVTYNGYDGPDRAIIYGMKIF